MNDDPLVRNRHPLASSYEERCESLLGLPASATLSKGQNSNHVISRNGERCVTKWKAAMKLAASNIVSEWLQ
jgi:hypothetical protein